MDAQEMAREDAKICAGIKRAQKAPVYKPRTVAVNSDKHDANDFVRRLMSKNRSMRQQIRMLRMKARLAEKKTMQEKREQLSEESVKNYERQQAQRSVDGMAEMDTVPAGSCSRPKAGSSNVVPLSTDPG